MRILLAAVFIAALSAGAYAQAPADMSACLAEVQKLQNSPEFRSQSAGGGDRRRATAAASASAYLQAAAAAAKQGDERSCRDYLQRAQIAVAF